MQELVSPDTQDVVENEPTESELDAAERSEMEAIFDRAESEGIEDTKDDAEEGQLRGPDGKFIAKETDEPEEPVAQEEDATEDPAEPEVVDEVVDVPSFLSADMRKGWDKIPEENRATISKELKDYSDRFAAQGRKLTAIQPIADKVIEAAQSIPGMKEMTPAQIASDVFGLAKIQAEINQNPVETLLKVAQQYGALDGIKARLEGQPVSNNTPEMVSEMKSIRQENERLREQLNPDRIGEMVNETLSQREIQTSITEFSSTKEHYGAVENHLPQFIPVAQSLLGDGASPQDILQRSYDMAINALGLKASAQDETPKADPKQVEAAIKAKSVNVKSTSTGKSKPLTEREAMEQVWDRSMTG